MSTSAARGIPANWTQSDFDMWFYTNTDDPGSRFLAPTFANQYSYNAQTQQFAPSTLSDTSRLGTTLVGFDTSSQITPNLAKKRYMINSITFTATFTYDGSTRRVKYDDQPISQTQLLNEYATSAISNQRPMELYGVGYRAGFTGLEFGTSDALPPLIDEITSPYPAPGLQYIAYPIVRTETSPGAFADVDVMNSVTGGYSETAPAHTTAAFTPDPWAIGTTSLSVGTDVPDNTTFTFALDLSKPGVRSYVQDALQDGGLALFLSSLHNTGLMGAGGGYPRWFTKEAGFLGVPASRLPNLAIDYEILPAVPGDFNEDGDVDAADYVLWRNNGALQNQVTDPATVNQQDYIDWRARFGNTVVGAGLGSSQLIPEPSSLIFVTMAVAMGLLMRFGRIRK